MEKERKIKAVAKKFATFEEAENADDEYWANTTAAERFDALIDLRKMLMDNPGDEIRLQKVVTKRRLHEDETD